MSHTRIRIAWVGVNGPTSLQAFEERSLILEHRTDFAGISNATEVKAVVYHFSQSRIGQLTKWLRSDAIKLVDHGVHLCIIADDDSCHQQCRQLVQAAGLIDSVHISLNPKLSQVAELVCRAICEPISNPTLRIEGMVVEAQFQTLLSRAFCDCDSIVVQELPGGRTGTVGCVYAKFRDSVVGPRPLPFFVKYSDSRKIKEELEKYERYVSHYIPFNLRPQIDLDRCLSGHKRGILVGKFVTRSESLLEALRRGVGVQPIHSLFEDTLAGWRLQAYEGPFKGVQKGTFESEMPYFFRPEQIPKERLELAKKFGASRSPEDVKAALATLPEIEYRRSPMHGDLHCGNVRVRGIDSILIDFQLVRHGPLVVDPACLEVSLLFTAAGDKNDGWKDLVDNLYEPGHLQSPPPPASGPSSREWLWAAVRQLRMIALSCQTSPNEYLTALIYCLLRRSRFDEDERFEQERAAYAYVLAEQLLERLGR